MVYYVRVDRGDGDLVDFIGTDEDLDTVGSFVLDRANGSHIVAKRQADGSWQVWEYLPAEGGARLGPEVGLLRARSDHPHIWEGFEHLPGGGVSTKPAPVPGSLTATAEDLASFHGVRIRD